MKPMSAKFHGQAVRYRLLLIQTRSIYAKNSSCACFKTVVVAWRGDSQCKNSSLFADKLIRLADSCQQFGRERLENFREKVVRENFVRGQKGRIVVSGTVAKMATKNVVN